MTPLEKAARKNSEKRITMGLNLSIESLYNLADELFIDGAQYEQKRAQVLVETLKAAKFALELKNDWNSARSIKDILDNYSRDVK